MTPEDQCKHIRVVRELSKPGCALDKDSPNATINNREWFRKNGTARSGRRNTHKRITAEVLKGTKGARQERHALVLAGPPGAGKGRVADRLLEADRPHYVNVDADEFKKLLLREAIADGSFEAWIKPDEVVKAESQGEQFYPLELASLVHEESSRLAAELREDLITTGTNVIVDTVLGSERSALQLGRQFTEAGYQVTIIDVEVPFEVSEDRIKQRWQDAMQAAVSGESDALGGRWVPSAYTRPLFATEHGRSKSQDVAQRLADSCSAVMHYERHYTSFEEHLASQREQRPAEPVQEAKKVRSGPGARLK